MGWVLDVKVLKAGFYISILQLIGFGIRYRDNSLLTNIAIHKLNIYLTFAIEE